jgi:hypothetical protein
MSSPFSVITSSIHPFPEVRQTPGRFPPHLIPQDTIPTCWNRPGTPGTAQIKGLPSVSAARVLIRTTPGANERLVQLEVTPQSGLAQQIHTLVSGHHRQPNHPQTSILLRSPSGGSTVVTIEERPRRRDSHNSSHDATKFGILLEEERGRPEKAFAVLQAAAFLGLRRGSRRGRDDHGVAAYFQYAFALSRLPAIAANEKNQKRGGGTYRTSMSLRPPEITAESSSEQL